METLNAYEVGFKTSFLDGLARLNGAIYYYDYQDYQAFALESLTLYVFNTDAENKGGELSYKSPPLIVWISCWACLTSITTWMTPTPRPAERHWIGAPS